ncbi:MAG: hypothetical protein P8Z79_14405 [Sedimentisphaerales bacterium]|jgi:chromosome segregation ATPase
MAGWQRAGGCLCLLTCVLVVVGCKDREKEEALAKAEEARMMLARLKTTLSRTNREMTDLKEELVAVKENRNELQAQVDQLVKERSGVMARAGDAQERIKLLTAQSDDQAKSVTVLRSEIAELKTLVESQQVTIDEQKATIEGLQKTIEQLQGADGTQPEVPEEPEEPTPIP